MMSLRLHLKKQKPNWSFFLQQLVGSTDKQISVSSFTLESEIMAPSAMAQEVLISKYAFERLSYITTIPILKQSVKILEQSGWLTKQLCYGHQSKRFRYRIHAGKMTYSIFLLRLWLRIFWQKDFHKLVWRRYANLSLKMFFEGDCWNFLMSLVYF